MSSDFGEINLLEIFDKVEGTPLEMLDGFESWLSTFITV